MDLKNKIRTFLSGTAVIILLSSGLTASAGQIFNIVDLSGNGLTGQFEVESPTGVGTNETEEFFLPASVHNDGIHNLISLQVNINGETFTHTDDIDLPNLPAIVFVAGNVVDIDFFVLRIAFDSSVLDMLGTDYYYDTDSGTSLSGSFAVVAATAGSSSPVPEPSTYALLAIGLVAMGYCKKRKRRANIVG